LIDSFSYFASCKKKFKILEGPMPYSNLLNIKKGYKKVQRNIIKKLKKVTKKYRGT